MMELWGSFKPYNDYEFNSRTPKWAMCIINVVGYYDHTDLLFLNSPAMKSSHFVQKPFFFLLQESKYDLPSIWKFTAQRKYF